MRPRIVALYGEAIGPPALDRQEHGVVTAGTAVFQIADTVVVRSFGGVQQRQDSPLGDIARVGAGRVDRVVLLNLRSPEMNGLVAKIVSGKQPVLSHLPLNAQVPLVDITGFGILS